MITVFTSVDPIHWFLMICGLQVHMLVRAAKLKSQKKGEFDVSVFIRDSWIGWAASIIASVAVIVAAQESGILKMPYSPFLSIYIGYGNSSALRYAMGYLQNTIAKKTNMPVPPEEEETPGTGLNDQS